jgi:hypothetical protein
MSDAAAVVALRSLDGTSPLGYLAKLGALESVIATVSCANQCGTRKAIRSRHLGRRRSTVSPTLRSEALPTTRG